MDKKSEITEESLYMPIKEFLQQRGYKVNGEVQDCDVTAIKDEELIIVELKKNLSVSLLVQGVKRQKIADLVYVAIPKPKRFKINSKWNDILHLLRRLELGLLMVSFKRNNGFVEVVLEPQEFDRVKSIQLNKKKRASLIKEAESRYMDLNKGGSKGKKLVTAYRESAIFIATCLEFFGMLSPKQLRSLGCDNKKTLSILSENHYGWFYKIDRGIYDVTEEGKKALMEYPQLKEYYKNMIAELSLDGMD